MPRTTRSGLRFSQARRMASTSFWGATGANRTPAWARWLARSGKLCPDLQGIEARVLAENGPGKKPIARGAPPDPTPAEAAGIGGHGVLLAG